VYESEIKASFYAAQYSDIYVGPISPGNNGDGNIDRCYAECVITVSTSGQARLWIGGITSYSYNTVSNCASDIVCTASSGSDLHIGGTVGVLCQNAKITNCFAEIVATRNGSGYAAGVYQTNMSNNTASVKNSFTNHSLEKAKATSPDYVYNTLGWDKDIWEVTEGEYPRLR